MKFNQSKYKITKQLKQWILKKKLMQLVWMLKILSIIKLFKAVKKKIN